MPNHWTNHVVITCDSEQQQDILMLLSSAKKEFDFNEIKPMPQEYISWHTGTREFNGKKVEFWKTEHKCKMVDESTLKEEYNHKLLPECELTGEDFSQAVSSCPEVPISDKEIKKAHKKYGHVGWYDWCINEWGTKWNAYEISRKIYPDSIYFTFLTAWAPPLGIFEEIDEIFTKKFGAKPKIHVRGIDEGEDWDNPNSWWYYDSDIKTGTWKYPNISMGKFWSMKNF